MWASIVSTTTGDLPQLEQPFLSNRSSYSLARTFGNLKVRPKLMVLHNLFFLVLTCAAYFSLIPLFEKLIDDARGREAQIVQQGLRAPTQGEAVSEVKQSEQSYQDALSRARLTLFLVLGVIYLLA